MKKEIKVGDIKPIYNLSGFQVCKKVRTDGEQEWIPVERIADAEILSFIYQQKTESNSEEEITKPKIKKNRKKTLEEEKEELEERLRQLEADDDEEEDDEINDIADEEL